MKVYEAIARGLSDLGCTELFGVLGDGCVYVIDSFRRDCNGHYVAAVHEGSAVLMAQGWARVAGKVGVAAVTHGPGLANTVTALVEGVKAGTSMVLLAGDTPVIDREHAQNINQRELVAATGAGFEQLRSPETVAEDLARAFYRAHSEHRPIVFNMPVEFQWQEVEYQKPYLRLPETRSAIASSQDMDDAIGIIASSHLPVVIAGRGVSGPEAEAAVLRFARRIEAPVATSLRGKGLFADDPFHLGISGTVSHDVALDVIGRSDCLIVFGASLNKYTSGERGLTRNKRIIQINPVAGEIGRCTPVTVGMVGDPGLTADAMVKWLDEAEIPGSGARSDHLLEELQAYHGQAQKKLVRPTPAGTVDLYEVAFALEEALPKDRVFLTGSGRFMFAFWNVISVPNPRSYVDGNGFSSIGLGAATSMGAAKAAGDRPTLLVTGDGGFMLSGVSELATAVAEQLDLVVVIANDGSYGAEHIALTMHDMDPNISLLPSRDFARIAEAFGCQAQTVTSSAELQAAMGALAKRDRKRPLLIDVKIDPASVYGGTAIARP
ncbi:MAG TPA: thiamine pyrophosphate-binding protein [Eoetvoesiella sp.]|uniref:thiamine pyrophosphate-binding protein n=1 Tax=Eoetvoesiella sp. TaxID=1966355 RepID=UPI002BFAEBAA|nr:thiamine pyrophosphate-binding protein [Eoetvoesiella sp.]HWK60607.1 thiamine pyrophosphate-binding protein [Eoetvoesiella sp.]